MSIGIAVWSVTNPDLVPRMIVQGEFTIFAQLLNIIGGLGFFASFAYFMKQYYQRRYSSCYLLAAHCLLFGIAGVLFETSVIWDAAWWWWHVLRFIAYLVLIAFFLNIRPPAKKNIDASGVGEDSFELRIDFSKIIKLCGWGTVLLGSVVIVGWYAHIPLLIQVHPSLVPMQFQLRGHL